MIRRYQLWLSLLWVAGTGVIALLVLWRLFIGDDSVTPVISWLTPNLAPTLSLVTGVATFGKAPAATQSDIDVRPAFIGATVASLFYLLVLAGAVFRAFTTVGVPTAELLQPWSLFLGLFQGVTAGLLGIFFAKAPPK